MSHHYGEYWSNWKHQPVTPKEPELLDEIKTFLLTLHGSDKATELLQKIEAEAAKANKPQTDF
jgi:hypothetical protein|tara:strand:- start:1143 stop:1331 length:189 start_codon:yes stop_codon:yes gene_type:complete